MFAPVYFTSQETPRLHASQPRSLDETHAAVVLQYLNEGGANFVFRILPSGEGDALPMHLQGRLLRLRKDLPHVQSTTEQLSAYREYFMPLFPEESLIRHTPLELHSELPAAINAALKEIDRPSHRLQDFLPDGEGHGVLVTDMTPAPGDMLLQVKPKWLAQSPNAPANAKRCRTCALRAQRASKKVRTATDAQESCPLNLVSSDESDRRRAAQRVTDNVRLQDYLVGDAQPLLRTLRENQQKLDSRGVLDTFQQSDVLDLCKAMTIRDCTLFLRLTGDVVEARLADLDLKPPEKIDRWKKVEQGLIEQGWYANKEDSEHWREDIVCLLSRKRDE